jgi:hypothetical protein
MVRLRISLVLILTVIYTAVYAQVKVRLFANQSPESVVFSVTEGKYKINLFNGEDLQVVKGEPVIVTKMNGRLAVKKRGSRGSLCDSLILSGITGDDSFSLRMNNGSYIRQYYSGDLQCFPDLGTLVFINISDV